ncbi:MAG: MlaD family protein [Acidobacteria bacterium]|nr:MlaD family protein [Acidobacteriota bacterium]
MPQIKQKSLSELRVGLLVLLALAILILVIFTVSGDISLPGLRGKTIVRTEMNSVDGLRRGAEVRLSGVKVGSVKEIRFNTQIPKNLNAQNNIEIIMEIDGKLDGRPAVERIRTDSKAFLKTAGVLGDNIIDITPGTLQREQIKDGDLIPSVEQKTVGDIINAAQTAVGNLNFISDDIRAITRKLRVGEGSSFGKFINDESFYVNMDRAVRQAENLLRSIREGQGTAGQLINDPELYKQALEVVMQFRKISDTLNNQISTGKGNLGKFIKDEEIYTRASTLLTNLEQTSARLDRTAAKIERGEGNLGKFITDEKLFTDARETVDKLKTIATRLERGEGTAGLMLTDERLYNNVNSLSAELTKMLYDFRQNPRKYLSVKVALF